MPMRRFSHKEHQFHVLETPSLSVLLFLSARKLRNLHKNVRRCALQKGKAIKAISILAQELIIVNYGRTVCRFFAHVLAYSR